MLAMARIYLAGSVAPRTSTVRALDQLMRLWISTASAAAATATTFVDFLCMLAPPRDGRCPACACSICAPGTAPMRVDIHVRLSRGAHDEWQVGQAEAVAGKAWRDGAQRLRLDLRGGPVELDRLRERRRPGHPRQLAAPGPGRVPLRRPRLAVRKVARQLLQLGERGRRVGALDPSGQLVERQASGRAVFLQSGDDPLAILVRGSHGRASA
jgi:hypothetical protein